MTQLTPFALKDAPALIEAVFPAQKVSFEAQRERKAGPGQTLTSLGSYWKGRKPLILVRAIVLGSLLPQTADAEKDLGIFEKLMAFDDAGLARRALPLKAIKPKDIAGRIILSNPWDYFSHNIKDGDERFESICSKAFPLNPDELKINIQWRRDVEEEDKIELLRLTLATYSGYERKSILCKRPEEVDETWLYQNIWAEINNAYAYLGIKARSHQELIEQLGILRFGRKPVVGDTFSGGGSIPFEAARLGCDVYASDLNPIACMLTWSALNIIGASPSKKDDIESWQKEVTSQVEAEITKLGIETDNLGNRAKAYLYCMEARCPETGWMIPLSPSWVISNTNRLRKWGGDEFKPRLDDIFQERLYAVHWITQASLAQGKKSYFFTSATPLVLAQEQKIEQIVLKNSSNWQEAGLIPNMEIEPGEETTRLSRERGWTHWHHLFTPRQLLMVALLQKSIRESSHPEYSFFKVANTVNWISKLCLWATSPARATGGAGDYSVHVFYNQALNTHMNFASRSWIDYQPIFEKVGVSQAPVHTSSVLVETVSAEDIIVTDPPYSDAVHYHEITEYFIAWLRKNPPEPFDQWTWDSRRALAIKGSGDDFRKGMVNAYKAMADHMPDNGMQCVMFTHQDTSVWSDMIGIFWAAGLQVVGAWYIATETTSELKKGGYVQGTVILMLRKRPAGENAGFKQRLLPAIRAEVKRQIETMMHLNDEVKDKMGEPVFNDSDLQMAGYAAALKVLTAYTHIGGEDVTAFALKPRTKGEVTVVDEIVQQAAEAANSLLVPEGLTTDTWQKLSGIQRFYLRMMDIETTGATKLDNYQNFAKAFRVEDYSRVMGSMAANKAQLKRIPEFASRDLTESNEIGSTWLGHLIIGLQQLLAEVDPQTVIGQFQADLPDFMEIRVLLLDVLTFIENKAPEKATRDAAEVLGARLRNMRAIGN